jgi:hypothetical protein|tara:strand:+ start:601 stop:945 length:345 start_codon:yes stop_codon:yes gene_type:complete
MVDPSEVHQIGVQLCVPAASEAERRSGVSRCYYGCFLVARKITNMESVKKDVHQRVSEKLDEMGHSKLASDLRVLSNARKACDYDIYETYVGKEAQTMKKRSIILIEKLKELAS